MTSSNFVAQMLAESACSSPDENVSLGKETAAASDDSTLFSFDSSNDDDDSSSYSSDDDSSACSSSSSQEHTGVGGGLYISNAFAKHLKKSGSDTDLLSFLEKNTIMKNVMRQGADDDSTCDIVIAHQHSSAIFTSASLMDLELPVREPEQSPPQALEEILAQSPVETIPHNDDRLRDYFVPWNVDGYSVELTAAVRYDGLKVIQSHHEKGHNLQCSNRFGESLVHTAARRGRLDILEYLQQEAGVSLQVCCDSGRNPLHDACWSSEPNWDCILFLLERHPEFLLVADRKGFTPLQYAPKSTWDRWVLFLQDHAELLADKLGNVPLEDLFQVKKSQSQQEPTKEPNDLGSSYYRNMYFI